MPHTAITAGYFTPSFTCCTPSILYNATLSMESFVVPNSGILFGPFGEFSALSALLTPTLSMAAPKRSGLSVMALVVVMPPALVPIADNFAADVYLFLMRYSAQAIKSFQVLGL